MNCHFGVTSAIPKNEVYPRFSKQMGQEQDKSYTFTFITGRKTPSVKI